MATTLAAANRSFAAGVWRLADPKISLASMAAIFLGTCLAATRGPVAWSWLALVVFGIFSLEVAKNASGEVFDYDSGADLAVRPGDRSPFSGGKRVMVDGLLTRGETALIAGLGYGLGILAGGVIVMLREPRVLWLGVLGVAAAWAYHAPPARLAYRGLGELAVALCYGPLITGGTYLVLRQDLPLSIAFAGVPLGLLISAFLWINEFPDYAGDRSSGKRTLVVRLGRPRAARGFVVLLAAAMLAALLLPATGLPWTAWAGLLAFVPAFRAAGRLMTTPEHTPSIIPAQAMTLLGFLTFALLTGIGVLMG